MNQRHNHGRGIAVITIVTLAWAGLLLFTPTKAHSATPGPCAEAWQAPHSVRANQCRDQGWTIHVGPSGRGIVVSPHANVRYLWLPMCRNEDGSGQRSACTWNLGPRKQGNGVGLSYWVDTHNRVHYVWPLRPADAGWHSVTLAMADALAEGDLGNRHWERWRYRQGVGNHIALRSPSGRTAWAD